MNDAPRAALVQAGYRIVISEGQSGASWSVAARNHGDGLFVLCQGHPEYGTLSLLREYRRDVRRFLFGRGAVPYPRLPEGYLSAGAAATLAAFETHASASHVDPRELWEGFPYDQVATSVRNTWEDVSSRLYANWLGLARAALPAQV
jgi:homoserine O-succinyltransferase